MIASVALEVNVTPAGLCKHLAPAPVSMTNVSYYRLLCFVNNDQSVATALANSQAKQILSAAVFLMAPLSE